MTTEPNPSFFKNKIRTVRLCVSTEKEKETVPGKFEEGYVSSWVASGREDGCKQGLVRWEGEGEDVGLEEQIHGRPS